MDSVSQESPRESQSGDHLLEANMDNVRVLSSLLKTVHFKETATCFISTTGLRVTVEQSKSVQANCFIQSELFQYYSYTDASPCVFCVNLNALIECLGIFGHEANTTLQLFYDGYGTPLQLLLEENQVVTECSLQTLEANETLDFGFVSSNVCNKLIMKSECLKDVFVEMDTTSDFLEMIISNDNPNLRLATKGFTGITQFDYPKESEVIEVFECKATQRNKYKLALLKPSSKALNQSSKVSIRMDQRGFLSLQYMIVTEDKQICFVEYLCVPEEDNEEEGEEDSQLTDVS